MENVENKEIITELNNKIEDLTKRSVKKINELKEEIETIKVNQFHSRTIGKISEALSKAQGEMVLAGKDKQGYGFKYADLTEYIVASRPALTKFELSVSQLLIKEDKSDAVLTILSHSSGEWFKSTSNVLIGDDYKKLNQSKQQQTRGADITYTKKYAYAAITGVVANEEEDPDGREKSKNYN